MPNWANNIVTFGHSDPAMIDRVKSAFEAEELMQSFVPCPDELIQTDSVLLPEHHLDYEQQEARNKEFLEKYGYRNWYDWRVANWGTKWDVAGDVVSVDKNTIQIAFDSAWSPPIDFLQTMHNTHGFEVDAFYYEPGMMFCGRWTNGEDMYYSIPATSEEAAKVIPEDINEMFDIITSMEDWESAENS